MPARIRFLIWEVHMAQLQRLRARISFLSGEIRLFCLCLMLGSLLGALCQSIHGSVLCFPAHLKSASILQSWLRAAVFPVLMTVPLLLQNKALFRILFFIKGAVIAYAICAITSTGASLCIPMLCALFFESVLPLPGYLAISSLWIDQIDEAHPAIWLLIPACFLPLIGTLFKVLLL